ncbi:MAG: hypothetical protein AMXMBFR77_28350 [Phycisphaerales bacterium]|nr:MAG: hypothetical protein BroJett004_23930 [Planctomycetota bacterium]
MMRHAATILGSVSLLLAACGTSHPQFTFLNDSTADLALRVYEGQSDTTTLDAPLVGPGGSISVPLEAPIDPDWQGPRVRVLVAPITPRGTGDAYELALFKPPFRVRAYGIPTDLRFAAGAESEPPTAADIRDRPPPRVPGDAVR